MLAKKTKLLTLLAATATVAFGSFYDWGRENGSDSFRLAVSGAVDPGDSRLMQIVDFPGVIDATIAPTVGFRAVLSEDVDQKAGLNVAGVALERAVRSLFTAEAVNAALAVDSGQ